MEFLDIFDKSDEVLNYSDCFKGSKVLDFKVSEAQRRIEIILQPEKIIQKSIIMAVAKDIRLVYGLNTLKLFTKYQPELFSAEYYSEILTYIMLKIQFQRSLHHSRLP